MLDWLKQRLIDIVVWFGDLTVEVFKAAWLMVQDAACWVLDGVLGIAVSAVSALDVSGLSGYVASWGSLPSDVVNTMGLLGVGTASGIIGAAVVIRLALQLIPFTRLGS